MPLVFRPCLGEFWKWQIPLPKGPRHSRIIAIHALQSPVLTPPTSLSRFYSLSGLAGPYEKYEVACSPVTLLKGYLARFWKVFYPATANDDDENGIDKVTNAPRVERSVEPPSHRGTLAVQIWNYQAIAGARNHSPFPTSIVFDEEKYFRRRLSVSHSRLNSVPLSLSPHPRSMIDPT
ncbi:hypothetical protein VTO42DRAFT_7753 [Malbranchea cinnamomea]